MAQSQKVVEAYRALREERSDMFLEGPEFRMVYPIAPQMPLLESSLDRILILLRTKRDKVDRINVATILHQIGALGYESQMKEVILNHPLIKVT